MKNTPSLLLFIAALVAAIATWVGSIQDSKQKDAIEQLGEENKSLSKNIEQLQVLNNNLTNHFGNITQQNLDLTKQTKELTHDVKKLTVKSAELINQVKQLNEYSAAEHLQTGEIKLQLEKKSPNDRVYFKAGILEFDTTIEKLHGAYEGNRREATELPFYLKISGGKVLIDMSIYDIERNQIALIEDNKWRLNGGGLVSFNYDDEGFEVLDRAGRVAMNITIRYNEIIIKGIFIRWWNGNCIVHIMGDNVTEQYRFKEGVGIDKVGDGKAGTFNHYKHPATKDEFLALIQTKIDNIQVSKIFSYTGKDWLHKRNK